jgi:spheroidene monooxygenase
MSGTIGIILLANLNETARLRGFGHHAFGRLALAGTKGLTFAKVLGSGENAGFQTKPSLTHQGLFCAFATEADADAFLAGTNPLLQSFRHNARDLVTAKLRAYASRGRWSGCEPLTVTAQRPTGPIASLTRASIKPTKALAFWRHAPPSEASLRSIEGCLLSAGVGELPLIRQATFTVWETEAAMERYARSGAHMTAIREAYANGYFSESLFARFVPISITGTWAGTTWTHHAPAATSV